MLRRMIMAVMVVASTVLTSCTKEDLSACNPELRLKFNYLLNNQGVNLFGDEVDRITVFAFDAQGHYYATFSDGGKHLTNDYVMTLPLPEGKYTILAWGGDMKHYNTVSTKVDNTEQALTKGQTTLEQFRLMLKQQENKEAIGLYYGNVSDAESKAIAQQTYPIELIKNSNTIRVNITGIEKTAPTKADQTPQYDVVVTAANGTYNYDNTIPTATKTAQYRPHTTTETATNLTYNSNTLRLMIGQSPMLRVVNNQTGAEICNFNIVEAIMKDPKFKTQKDIDREDLFQFDFRINNDLSITITINGWSIIDVIPEL